MRCCALRVGALRRAANRGCGKGVRGGNRAAERCLRNVSRNTDGASVGGECGLARCFEWRSGCMLWEMWRRGDVAKGRFSGQISGAPRAGFGAFGAFWAGGRTEAVAAAGVRTRNPWEWVAPDTPGPRSLGGFWWCLGRFVGAFACGLRLFS